MKKSRFIEERRECARFQQQLKNNMCCLLCGTSSNLSWHHVKPSEKMFTISNITKIEQLIKEVAKCVVLCGNCHWEVHHK